MSMSKLQQQGGQQTGATATAPLAPWSVAATAALDDYIMLMSGKSWSERDSVRMRLSHTVSGQQQQQKRIN